MSSSDRPDRGGEFFVPDVDLVSDDPFVPDTLGAPEPDREPATALSLAEYRTGPSEEELRERITDELSQGWAQELEQIRSDDAERMRSLVAELRTKSQAKFEEIGRLATELAFAVAERLVRARIESDATVIERVLRDCIEAIDESVELRIRANPEDAAHLRLQPELLQELSIVDVVSDPTQRRGGCKIEYGDHGWDASLTSQMSAMHEALTAAVREDP